MELTALWYFLLGLILIVVGLSSSYFEKLPVTTSIVYFLFGVLLGPYGFHLVEVDLILHSVFFERLTEVVVLISLFVAGMKLRMPFHSLHWSPTWRLAFFAMLITVTLTAAFSYYALSYSLGAAVLLGAILAPTDPVLASAVQVRDPEDRDRLRFSLTGEAGLNDGTAFPFVMLGLGLLGLHDIGIGGLRWLVVDLLWAVPIGLGTGWILGTQISRLVVFIRKKNEETVILDDFLAIGLIALAYGIADLFQAYGFLAAFTAGLAMRRIGKETEPEKALTSSHTESVTMAKAVRSFTEQLERLGEVASVILLGAMFNIVFFKSFDLILIPVLFLAIRPLSVFISLLGFELGHSIRKSLIGWFGIRGIGSIYYLTYSIRHGLDGELAQRLAIITYCTVVISIFVHGMSGLPVMKLYKSKTGK